MYWYVLRLVMVCQCTKKLCTRYMHFASSMYHILYFFPLVYTRYQYILHEKKYVLSTYLRGKILIVV